MNPEAPELETRARITFGVPVMVTRPVGDELLPAVLVLHEAWGLTPDIAAAAERIALAGYMAVAPDLLSGPARLAGILGELRKGSGTTVTVVGRILDLISAMPDSTDHVGVVGFSMGGALALLTDRHPAVAAISANYCMVPRAALSHRPVPVVASFGARDLLLPRSDRPLRRRLAGEGVAIHDVVRYPRVGHSFMTEIGGSRERGATGRLVGMAHQPGAAEHAWSRTLAFLDAALHPASQEVQEPGEVPLGSTNRPFA
ncbi:MAG: dienelactone hydrolase family protein [Acidimicrobiia bacterium]